MNPVCLKSVKQTRTITFHVIGHLWYLTRLLHSKAVHWASSSPYHKWPEMCWAEAGSCPPLVLIMTWDLMWHRAGKMFVECWWNAASSFLLYKRQWYLLSCTESPFPGTGFQEERQRPPASSLGAIGDRDSPDGQCWVATLSSSKGSRDHLDSEIWVPLREAGLTQWQLVSCHDIWH